MESGDVKAVRSVKVGQSKGASRANEVRKAKTKGVIFSCGVWMLVRKLQNFFGIIILSICRMTIASN